MCSIKPGGEIPVPNDSAYWDTLQTAALRCSRSAGGRASYPLRRRRWKENGFQGNFHAGCPSILHWAIFSLPDKNGHTSTKYSAIWARSLTVNAETTLVFTRTKLSITMISRLKPSKLISTTTVGHPYPRNWRNPRFIIKRTRPRISRITRIRRAIGHV